MSLLVQDPAGYPLTHHTPADTLYKIDPLEMKKQVAVLAMLTWYLAEMPEQLKRLPPGGKAFDD